VLVWDTRTDTSPRRFSGHAREVYAVAFSPDGMLLASGSRDATVRLWDVASGALRATLSGHDSSVQGVAFSPDGHTLASADLGPYYPGETAKNHGSVRLWRIK
jgi:WD40 repeat protein